MPIKKQKTVLLVSIFLVFLSSAWAFSNGNLQSPEDDSFIQENQLNISFNNNSDINSANYTLTEVEGDSKSGELIRSKGTFSRTVPVGSDGRYKLYVSVEDGSITTEYYNLTFDSEKPNLNINLPTSKYHNSPIEVKADYSDETTSVVNASFRVNTSGTIDRSLNGTLKGQDLTSGNHYQVNFSAKDQAGNFANKSKIIAFDSDEPVYEDSNLDENSEKWVNDSFYLDSTWSSYSPIEQVSYSILDGDDSQIRSGIINQTVDLSNLDLGESENLTVQLNATDAAGNKKSKEYWINADLSSPELNVSQPDEDVVQGLFSVNAAHSDDESGTDSLKVHFLEQEHSLNYTVSSSNISDGNLGLEVISKDKAGNIKRKLLDLTVDNKPPEIDEVLFDGEPLSDNDYIPSDFSLEIDAEDEGTSVSKYKYKMDGGYKNSNDSQLSFSLSGGSYNLSLNLSDETGNWKNSTYLENLQVDETEPELDYSIDNETDDWIKDGISAEVSCDDSGSGDVSIALFRNDEILNSWENADSRTLSLYGNGEETFEFRCRDIVGNTVESDSIDLNVDSKTPEVANSTPEDGASNVETRFNMDYVFNENSLASGLNTNDSEVRLYGDGEINDVQWLPESQSGSVSLAGLNSYQDYTLNVFLKDGVGHNSSNNISFTTGEKLFRKDLSREESLEYGITNVNIEAFAENGTAVVEFKDSDSVSNVNISARKDLPSVNLSVQELSGPPGGSDSFEGEVYSYFEISSEKSESLNLNEVEFSVTNSWLNQTGVNQSDVFLSTLNSNQSWARIETSLTDQNIDRYNYRASPANFSGFLVGASVESEDSKPFYSRWLSTENMVSVILTILFLLSFFYFLIQLMNLEVDIDSKFKIKYASAE